MHNFERRLFFWMHYITLMPKRLKINVTRYTTTPEETRIARANANARAGFEKVDFCFSFFAMVSFLSKSEENTRGGDLYLFKPLGVCGNFIGVGGCSNQRCPFLE